MAVSSETFVDISSDLLSRGHSVRFKAPGRSMHPTIKEGETITIEPVAASAIKKGDIIFYRSKTGVIAHRVIGIEKEEIRGNCAQSSMAFDETRGRQNRPSGEASLKANRPLLESRQGRDGPQSRKSGGSSSAALSFILRGDASDTCDEPVTPEQILGKVVSMERAGRNIDLYRTRAQVARFANACVARFKGWMIRMARG